MFLVFRGSSPFMQAMRLWVGYVGDLIRSSNTYVANKVNIILSLHFFIEILSLRWVSENKTIFTLTIPKNISILFLFVGFGIKSAPNFTVQHLEIWLWQYLLIIIRNDETFVRFHSCYTCACIRYICIPRGLAVASARSRLSY